MELTIFKNSTSLAQAAADEIVSTVIARPNALLCLAAGDTPLATYQLLARKAREKKVDFSAVQFVALDEWVGIDPQNSGSCQYFLRHSLFIPMQIAESQQHYFNALASNMGHECVVMNSLIADYGGIDLMLVGVGMNGHIGFNEPGADLDLYAHVTMLDNITLTVGQKYFSQAAPLKRGITLGLRHFLEARKTIVMASGLRKAAVMKQVLEDEISARVPASIVRRHPEGKVMIDTEAASMLAGISPS